MAGFDLYARLRQKVTGYTGPYQEYVLLMPDVVALITRLMLDPRVEARHKAYLGAALAYVVSPIDILPERVLGAVGYLDDLAVMVAVLNILLTEVDEDILLEHWSGETDLLALMRTFLGRADDVMGKGRLDEVLRRMGVKKDVTV